MNTYACKYCNNQWSTNQSRNGHQVHCPRNPKKLETEQKVKQSNKGKSFKPISKHWVEKTCPKCNKVYSVYITKESESLGRYKQFCSPKCSNSRQHSQQTKDKIGNALKQSELKRNIWITKYCIQCGQEFQTHKHNTIYCKKCRSLQAGKHINWSAINKLAYSEGRNRVGGGTTKWVEVETSNGIIKVQGSYQQRMCKILDKMKEIGDIQDWQYTNDRISYVGIDNKEHSYLLDFKVYHNDQSIRYIQTKGRVQENDYCKWTATKQKGFNLQICFQKDIKDYEIKYNI